MEERSKKIVWGLSDLRWFDKGVEWKVGKGDKIKFWCDACGKNKTLPIYIPDFSSFHSENLTKLKKRSDQIFCFLVVLNCYRTAFYLYKV